MKTTAHLVFEYQSKRYEIDDVWAWEWVDEDTPEGMEFWWTEGNGGCDCNRSLYISKSYPDFPELDCGDEIELKSINITLDKEAVL